MSDYYTPQRKSNFYSPEKVFPLSRSKIDLFIECPFCFYLDCKLGIKRPPGYPFTLNSAVDKLLKKEFDYYRDKKESHPLMKKNNIEAIPFSHEKLSEWQNNFKGVQYLHEPTNFLTKGAVDDVWINKKNELIVVDYKATSKNSQVNLDQDWQKAYKRQMEVYQWLLRKNEFEVSNVGYFVYCNGVTDNDFFDQKLEFEISVLPYKGNDDWIENTLVEAKKCLEGEIPPSSPECDFCLYRKTLLKNKIYNKI